MLDIGKDLEDVSFDNLIRLGDLQLTRCLKACNLLIGQGIGLGNDGNQVDLGMKSAHDLNVQRLQGVASRLDEVDAGMDAVVDNVHAVDLVLSLEVGIESLLDVLDNWSPRLVVVDKVTETRGINNRQAKTDTVLLDVGADGLDRYGLGDDVEAGSLALFWRVEGGVEESVDQGGLSETRFT